MAPQLEILVIRLPQRLAFQHHAAEQDRLPQLAHFAPEALRRLTCVSEASVTGLCDLLFLAGGLWGEQGRWSWAEKFM